MKWVLHYNASLWRVIRKGPNHFVPLEAANSLPLGVDRQEVYEQTIQLLRECVTGHQRGCRPDDDQTMVAVQIDA